MQYASKITIKKEPQIIKYTKKVTIFESLTLEVLNKHIKPGQKFDIFKEDGGLYGDPYHLEIYCERLETEQEVSKRVTSQEKYNENYEIFNAKYRNK